MSTSPQRLGASRPSSKLADLDPVERLVLRVNSLERWARTLSAQHDAWRSEVGRFAAQLEITADRLAQFSDNLSGLDPSPNFDLEPPF